MGGDEHVKLVPLQPSSQEYKDVESSFLSTAQQSVNAVKKVRAIIKIQLTVRANVLHCKFISHKH